LKRRNIAILKYPEIIKPTIDLMGGLFFGLIFLPVVILMAIFYLFNGITKFIFIQERIGKDGNPFKIYKIKTLKDDPTGVKLDEERKYWFSDFLRKASIDELPQLINILKGEMSFIGPRPLLPEYLDLYNERQRKRHQVKPGITGLAQVNAGKVKNWQERLELDVKYVEQVSLLLDLKIMLKTAVVIFSGRNLYHLDQPFTGNE
jgi:lipopolysaccharide/colanic/teichoic acid biosynthesis glycosyltransferase